MPSVNSSSRPNVWPSSTFTTPSLPTFSIAFAITSPISRSRAEIVATRAMSSLPEISFDCDFRFSTTCSTACSMPRLSAIGFAPAATFFRPSRPIPWASSTAAAGAGVRRRGDLTDELRALVLEDVLDLDLTRDRDAVVRDRRSTELLVEHHVAPLRAKGDLDRVGEDIHAPLERAAGILVELQLLVSHLIPPDRYELRGGTGELAFALATRVDDLREHI